MENFSQTPELDIIVSGQLKNFCLDFFPKSQNRILASLCARRFADDTLQIWGYDSNGLQVTQLEILRQITPLAEAARQAQIDMLRAIEAGHQIEAPDFDTMLLHMSQQFAVAIKRTPQKGYFIFFCEKSQFAFLDASTELPETKIITLSDILDEQGANQIAQQIAEAQRMQQEASK